MDINYIDLSIGLFLLIALMVGFARGLVWLVVFIFTWAVAAYMAYNYAHVVLAMLPIQLSTEKSTTLMTIIVGVAIFVMVLFIGALINAFIAKLIDAPFIGFIDKFLGAVAGLILGVIVIILGYIVSAQLHMKDEAMWQSSFFIPHVQRLSQPVDEFIDQHIDEISQQIQGLENVDSISNDPSSGDQSAESSPKQ